MCGMLSTYAQATETYSGHTVADEGAWCWFADPRALHYENEAGTINMTYIGYIDYHGSIKATQVDWKTKTTSEVMIRSWFQPDDHDNPAFLVLPDERIMIIYSRHTDEACFYYRISKRPGDITSLGEEKRLATANNTTYPNPYILSDDPDHIYMCWRGIGWHPTVAQMSMPDANDNIKFTWGPYQMVQSTGSRPYAKYISNGKDKIYLAYTTGHPDNEYPNWLYCNAFDVNDKCLYDLNGKKLSKVQDGKFNVSKTDSYKSSYPATVVDATANRRDWIWNMAFDGKGNPVIGMTKISQDKQNHEYYYAKWNGAKWNATFVADGGKYFHHSSNTENCYSSGMAIYRDNVNTVYCGVPVNGIHEIWKYTLDDSGKVTASEAITKNSAKSNARPFVIEGTKNAKDGADALRLSWMNGDYYYWIANTTYKAAYPTSIMAECDMPQNMEAKEGFSVAVDGIMPGISQYKGDMFKVGDIVFGVNEKQYSYIKIGGKTYVSSNVFGTADSWMTENKNTTDGVWYSKTPYTNVNITLTADGNMLTVYVNGIIDQKIEYTQTAMNSEVSAFDAFTITKSSVSPSCQTQSQIKRHLLEAEVEAVVVPQEVRTDFVLPQTTLSGKSIAWTSSREDIVSNSGIVNLSSKSAEVTLTASIAGIEKAFKVKVLPRDVKQNIRASLDNLDQSKNTASGFATNAFGRLDEGLLKGMRSYTVILKAKAKSLSGSPRLYDFGGGSGNSMFLRAKDLSAGIKYNGGTTTMVNSPVALKENQEYSLAVTFDAGTKMTTIYIDGQEVVSGTANQSEPYMLYESAGDARNYVGRTQWWDGAYAKDNVDFVGTISNLVVYDIALTQKEVCDAQRIPFQEKEYSKALVNGDFESSYAAMSGSGVTSDRAIYVPEGWNIDYGIRNENDFTALKNGDFFYSQFFASKPQNTNGGKQSLWIRQRWGESSICMNQQLKLDKGNYSLTADIFASDTKDETYVYVNNMKKSASKVNAWQTVTFDFEADGESVFEIGLKSIHTNNDAERILAFDNFILTKVGEVTPDAINAPSSVSAERYYSIDGVRINSPRKGINIKMGKDGKVEKIIY